MKILVTNNTFGALGGSETYAFALIMELNRRNDITVHGFSKTLGFVSNRLRERNIPVFNEINQDYDFVFASHNTTIPFLKDISGKKVQTCHGIFPPPEQPVSGVDKYVAISQEVKNHLKSKGVDSTVIFNGVDCKRFKPTKPINKQLKTVLSLSQSEELNNLFRIICNEKGLKFISLNKFTNPVFNVEHYINEADLVVSLGRGAYEAMACGRNVMVLDKRPYINKPHLGDGMVNETNVRAFMSHNCSGRHSNIIFDKHMIMKELSKYNHNNGDWAREFALQELNISKQVDKYFNLWK
jgi:hypothetical protein